MDGGDAGNVAYEGDDTPHKMMYLDADRVRDVSLGDVFGCSVAVEGGEGLSESKIGCHCIEPREASGRAIRCSSLEVLVEWLVTSR